jgi:hypothetical protein
MKLIEQAELINFFKLVGTQKQVWSLLVGGRYAFKETDGYRLAEIATVLLDAIKKQDYGILMMLLRNNAEFDKLFGKLCMMGKVEITPSMNQYHIRLMEICNKSIRIDNVLYLTYNFKYDNTTFIKMAMSAFESMPSTNGWVLVGAWLEKMVTDFDIHPIFTRNKLSELQDCNMINLFTQGSTPDTRFESHKFLTLKPGNMKVETVYLYHGNFLIPDKASVSMRLERT